MALGKFTQGLMAGAVFFKECIGCMVSDLGCQCGDGGRGGFDLLPACLFVDMDASDAVDIEDVGCSGEEGEVFEEGICNYG